MLSFPPSGSSCVAGSCGQLSGHGPPKQEHAGVRTANPPGVTGECVCVLGRWGIGEELEREKRNESERERESQRPHCTQLILNASQKNTVKCFHCVSFQCGPVLSHRECSHLLTTVPIDVKCHHAGCSGSVVALELSMDDKHRVEAV